VDASGKTILVVDDTPANLRLLSQMLAEQGYKVRVATSGVRALASVEASPPDLILLDIRMPEMDGYAVCERLKAQAGTREIPVVFISSLGETEGKVRAFAVGGVDYVPKPFQVEEVVARVHTHLEVRRLQHELQEANRRLEERLAELRSRNEALQEALSTIKTLKGLIPLCAWCGRKIRDEEGNWVQMEDYITTHSEAEFSHGICPECRAALG
jgi:PleD family two-component response regulator